MKAFLSAVMKWKNYASLMYTAAMAIYLLFSLLFHNNQIPLSILWDILLMCAAGSLLQMLCFSDLLIRRMRYTRRSLLFVGLFLPLLSVFAWKMEWFPADQVGAWAIFIGIFFLIFILMTVGFDVYFQATGRKYDGLIGQYRRSREEEDPPKQ